MKNVGILKWLLMVEGLLEILTKGRSQMFCQPVDVHCVANAVDESISLISNWNIVNPLGRHVFSFGLIFLVRCYENYSIIGNLRYFSFVVNEII